MSVTGGSVNAIIHVVDDDDSVRKALTRLLRVAGFDVQAYASAEQFMSAGTNTGPGCVILDINMPGAGGLELQQVLANGNGQLPVIFVSGDVDARTSADAIEAGAVAFLDKPVDRDELLDAVRRALSRNG